MTINQDTAAPQPVLYRFYEEPHVVAVKPPRGPIGGGTYVELTGFAFDLKVC